MIQGPVSFLAAQLLPSPSIAIRPRSGPGLRASREHVGGASLRSLPPAQPRWVLMRLLSVMMVRLWATGSAVSLAKSSWH